MDEALDLDVGVGHVDLLALGRRDVVPLPDNVLAVRAGRAGAEDAPHRRRGELGRYLPDPPLGVVAEEHQVLVLVPVQGGQQAVAVVLVLHSAKVA